MHLLDGVEGKDTIAFEDDLLLIQRLKSSFICFLWSKTKLFIDDCPLTLVSLIGWNLFEVL